MQKTIKLGTVLQLGQIILHSLNMKSMSPTFAYFGLVPLPQLGLLNVSIFSTNSLFPTEDIIFVVVVFYVLKPTSQIKVIGILPLLVS